MTETSRMDRFSGLVICLAVITLATFGGCTWGRGAGQPAWIEGTSRTYPPDQYLIGVGQADSQPAAAERAYAAVAKIFKAEVSAQSRDWEFFLLKEQRGTTQTERRLTLDQITRVTTDKVLQNVRILEGWFDPRSGRHYALAGMNRSQAATAFLERIEELDGAVESDLKESRQGHDLLARLRSLRRAAKNLVLREAYNADLRVVRPSGHGTDPRYHVADLTSELEQFMTAHLAIGVAVTGDQAEPVRRAVMEGLIREGLPVTSRPLGLEAGSAGAEAVVGTEGNGAERPLELLVKGTVRLWKANVPDPQFKYVRWCSDFVIVEAGTQRVVGAVSRAGKEGHLTEGEASAKATKIMQQEVTSELAKTLAGYVYGEVDQPGPTPPAACPKEG
ncbi:MAG: hypothetical protein FJ246_09020 [Nitrospira sp.]|nr:hypothetical protein [Nitrospira sp.]